MASPVASAQAAPFERRISPRVVHPIKVRIDDRVHVARDWSITGLSLESVVEGYDVGDIVKLELFIGETGTNKVAVHLALTSRVVRAVPGGAVAFEFVSPSPRATELLHRVTHDCLAGQGPAVERLLLQEEEGRQRQRSGRTLRTLREIVQLAALAFLLGAGALFAVDRLARVDGVYAAVTAPVIRIAIPVTGMVEGLTVTAGDRIASGETIATIRSAATAGRLAILEGERAALLAMRERQAERVGEIRTLTETMEGTRARQLAILDAQIEAIERQVAAEQRLLERLDELRARQLVRLNAYETQAARVAAAEAQVAALGRERERLAVELSLAGAGFNRADQPDNVPTVAAMTSRIRETDARIAGLDREIAALSSVTLIASPCDCLVHRVLAQPGEWVGEANVLALLVRENPLFVDALIPAEDARRLRLGASARISFADGREAEGRLVELTYEPTLPGWVGLPERVPGQERFALARVRPDAVQSMPVGLTASVRLRPTWWANGEATAAMEPSAAPRDDERVAEPATAASATADASVPR